MKIDTNFQVNIQATILCYVTTCQETQRKSKTDRYEKDTFVLVLCSCTGSILHRIHISEKLKFKAENCSPTGSCHRTVIYCCFM
jgi:hypothetical protein